MLFRRLVQSALLAAAALALSAGTAAAEPAVGVIRGINAGSSYSMLASFDTEKPGSFTDVKLVTGLGPGEKLADVDFRYHPNGELSPLPGPQLFGLTFKEGLEYSVRLYTIDLATGAATPVGPEFGQTPAGNTYGIDFNPSADRVRVVDDFDANFRVNPNNGALAVKDTNLNPAGHKVAGVAYDRVDQVIPPVVPNNTTAYAIDTSAGSLVTIGDLNGSPKSPNEGVLVNPKPLGVTVNPNTPVGFDIDRAGAAYASIVGGSGPGLYSVNLATGAAALIGALPVALNGLAIVPSAQPPPPPPGPDTAAPSIALAGVKAKLSFAALLKGVTVKATPSEPAALDGELLGAAKSAKLASFNLTLATKALPLAAGQRTIKLKPPRKLLGSPTKALKLRLQVTATDAAGNAGVATRTIKVTPPKPRKAKASRRGP
jgi:hypothetical protein